jgi:hypothetical protein
MRILTRSFVPFKEKGISKSAKLYHTEFKDFEIDKPDYSLFDKFIINKKRYSLDDIKNITGKKDYHHRDNLILTYSLVLVFGLILLSACTNCSEGYHCVKDVDASRINHTACVGSPEGKIKYPSMPICVCGEDCNATQP